MIIAGVVSVIMPWGSNLHWGVLFFLRFIVGLVHGVIWPSMAVIMSHWAPPDERGRLVGFMNAGNQLFNIHSFIHLFFFLIQVLKLVMF
jgi:predicted MFS family arabinose efflux permease